MYLPPGECECEVAGSLAGLGGGGGFPREGWVAGPAGSEPRTSRVSALEASVWTAACRGVVVVVDWWSPGSPRFIAMISISPCVFFKGVGGSSGCNANGKGGAARPDRDPLVQTAKGVSVTVSVHLIGGPTRQDGFTHKVRDGVSASRLRRDYCWNGRATGQKQNPSFERDHRGDTRWLKPEGTNERANGCLGQRAKGEWVTVMFSDT